MLGRGQNCVILRQQKREERERSNFYLDLHFAFPQITNRDPMTQYYKTGLGRRLEPYLRLSNTRYT